MEPQVIIQLSEYNELMAFKEKMEEEHCVGTIRVEGTTFEWRYLEIYGKSDIIEGLRAEIENRDERIKELVKEILELKYGHKKKEWSWLKW